MPPFSIKESLILGWEAFKAYYHVFIPIVFLTVVISLINEYINGRGEINTYKDFYAVSKFVPDMSIIGGAVLVLSIIAQIIIGMGLIKIALNVTTGKPATFDDIFSVTHLFFAYVGAVILYGLIVIGGFLLLIVPGILWLVSYWLFQYALIDKELGVLAALSEAKRISKDVRWPLFKFMIVTGVLNIAGVLMFGIGLFVTIPITAVATAHVYRSLQKHLEPEQVAEEEKMAPMQPKMTPSVNSL